MLETSAKREQLANTADRLSKMGTTSASAVSADVSLN